MVKLFYKNATFNGDISKWNTANQNISAWNVAEVTTMRGMFFGATSFDQPLNRWDVAKVANMNFMFYNATSFNQNISGWQTLAEETLQPCSAMLMQYKNQTSQVGHGKKIKPPALCILCKIVVIKKT